MKIHVEFDLTPEEFRRALGLPDVAAFQQALLEQVHKQMEAGVEGYDPLSLLQPFLQSGFSPDLEQKFSQGLASFGSYQQMMLDMLRQAGNSMAQAQEPPESDTAADAPKTSKRESASARSRSQRSE